VASGSGLWSPDDERFRDVGEQQQIYGAEGPQLRLLFCAFCKSIEELPNYVGPPEQDVVLDAALAPHQDRHPHALERSGALFSMSEQGWNNRQVRKTTIEQVWSALGVEQGPLGLDPEFYASKNTFVEDANKCFVRHNRSIPCVDWKSDSKRIGNPTKKGWDAGQVKVYLCQFCPVASKVMEAQRLATGGYE